MPEVFRRTDQPNAKTYYTWINGKRTSTGCDDKRAAEARARVLQREAADPVLYASQSASLEDALELLIKDRQSEADAGNMSAETVDFYAKKAGVLLRHLGRKDGSDHAAEDAEHYVVTDSPCMLADVTAALVDDYIAKRRKTVKDSAIDKELVTWRSAMKLAKRRGLWSGDLSAIFPIAFGSGYKPRERWLSPSDWLALVDDAEAIDMPESRRETDSASRKAILAIVAFSIATSAEWAAIQRARREDIAPDFSAVHVRGSKDAHGADNRNRRVPIELLGCGYLLAYALEHADGDGLLLFRPKGNIRARLRDACKRTGIDHVSPNDLRRTHAKWLVLAGVDLPHVSMVMGHADTRMVYRVYGKVQPTEIRHAIAARVRDVDLVNVTANAAPSCNLQASQDGRQDDPRTVTDANGGIVRAPRSAPKTKKPGKRPGFAVPRDGIEPPTRGFSSRARQSESSKKKANSATQGRSQDGHFPNPSADDLRAAMALIAKATGMRLTPAGE